MGVVYPFNTGNTKQIILPCSASVVKANWAAVVTGWVVGQASIKHSSVSKSGPGHGNPPLEGGGIQQVLWRVWTPGPQGSEQLPYSPHSLQLPLAKNEKNDARI